MRNQFTMLFILFVTLVNAQNFQGKAYYQTKRTFEMKLDSSKVNDQMQKQLQEMLKKQFEKTYILTFNRNESIYKEEERLEKPQPNSSGIIIQVGNPSNVLYKDHKNNTYANSLETFGKRFIIKDSIKPLDWKFTKESKMIGKYLCLKATTSKFKDDYDKEFNKKETRKEIQITAWYTPEIPVRTGPENYGNLPGLILELHEDKMQYVCNKIIINPKNKIKIEVPKKGKIINQKDFDTLQNKQLKKMMKNFDGGRKKGKNGSSFTIKING